MKPRRFAEGGATFSAEQEKWLGGADRTDPYILARMRRAVPDTPSSAPAAAPAPSKVPAAALAAANATEDPLKTLIKSEGWDKKDAPAPATEKPKSPAPKALAAMERRSAVRMADVAAKKPAAETTDRPRQSPSLYQEPPKTNLAAMERRSATRRADVAAKKPAAERRSDVRLRDSRNLPQEEKLKRGGAVKRYANGGSVSSRADGIAAKGKTRGRMC